MARLIGEELDEKRRTQILEAALYCFLTFGFAKTSMDDIAKRAGVSRPLIYLKFKNKDELFTGGIRLPDGGTLRAGDGCYQRPRLTARAAPRRFRNHARGALDFYEVCSLQLPQVTATYARNSIRCAEAVLGDHEAAEEFFFATEGLHSDLPSAKVLLKRLRILVNQFARE
jgi:TetR/AcrR family transcriptional regulator, transcriptional repressor of aconitase